MEEQNKILAFEYLLYKLVTWHNDVTGLENNDISILKALKLLFFVSTINYDEDSDITLLDGVFDKFVAMPFGHVETDIYDFIKSGRLNHVDIDTKRTIINEGFDPSIHVENDIRARIDSAVMALIKKNKGLIKYTSFQLVDLSHSWYSWKYYFSKAQDSTLKSLPIPSSVIKSEEKFFELSFAY